MLNQTPSAITTRRLKSEEIRQALLNQLGIDPQDFLAREGTHHNSPTQVLRGALPLYTSDEAPRLHYRRQDAASERMTNLGAPSWLKQQPRS